MGCDDAAICHHVAAEAGDVKLCMLTGIDDIKAYTTTESISVTFYSFS
jgi:hypothetical protein